MNKLSFYEQVGIVIPGSVLLAGIIWLRPELKEFVGKDGVTVGGLGIFVLIAYALGHLLAAVGNVLENILWRPFGGMPSNWVVSSRPSILTAEQVALMERLIAARSGLVVKLQGLSPDKWRPVFHQLYRDVLANSPGRVETFNGNYGLNRGLAAACIALSGIVLASAGPRWAATALVAAGGVYLYRAYRFGIHFACELYTRFLLLPAAPATPGKPPKAASEGAE